AGIMRRAVYDAARANAGQMVAGNLNFATVGIASGTNEYMSIAVEIDDQHIWALDRVLEHALRSGVIPEILRRQVKEIIGMGASAHMELAATRLNGSRPKVATPDVLTRLPYYNADDIEYNIPVYKAEYQYPLVILKKMPQGGPKNPSRFLILDSSEDLGVVRLAEKQAGEAEAFLNEAAGGVKMAVLITNKNGKITVSTIAVTGQQKNKLSAIIQHFEQSGYGVKRLSGAAKKVIRRTIDRSTPDTRQS
ncbi:hypothetical protein ACFLTW_04915, partial [Chloroflexota bacterium]